MIHVVATLKVDPAQREAFLAEVATLIPSVLAEDGCVEYGPAIDESTGIAAQEMAGDDAVVMIEKWESVAALEAHLAAPHMDAFRDKVAAMLKGLSLQVLKPAS